ncbi:MAG: hypothetical protein GY788_22665 [bacterium]|nr:hypothetical protein [bacterium]
MRKLAWLTAFALVVALLPVGGTALAQVAPGGTFLDDDNSPHEGAIEAIAAIGVTKGCNPPVNNLFCPGDPVTRGQMAAFLVRALNLPATTDAPFTDSGGVFEDAINRLAAAGITKGCNPPANTRYCPDDSVTRGQMAAFLDRALDHPATTDAPFTDSGGVFEDAIDRLAAAGITKGCNPPANTRYCPSNPVLREQMATFLMRGLGLSPIVPPPRPGPPTGNPDGDAPVPTDGQAESIANPDIAIGNGTAASCTSQAVVDAVAEGGVIVFDCGPDPVTIEMLEEAKVFNDTGPEIVIDGGGLVTLSGRGQNRILYMNTCDQSLVWTTSHCQNQDHPRLTVQNLTFIEGNSKGDDPDGGGAIWVRGGRFKIVNSRFFNNVCDDVGPDVGGAAVRVSSQYQGLPVYVVNSTFGGADGYGNVCSNGGGLSSIGVSYTVINSRFTHNLAIGNGANPAQGGTPGGGSGGAIYNDGNTFTLTVIDTVIEDNHANEGGGAIFYVSNDRSGTLRIEDSTLRRNPSDGFETRGFPGIFYLGNGPIQVVNSTIED